MRFSVKIHRKNLRKMNSTEFYKIIIGEMKIQEGDKIYFASDVIQLVLTARHLGIDFEINDFIDELQETITETGTLLIPTFCYDFSNLGKYDYRIARCNTGAVGNTVLKRKDFTRTMHPMHSFMVWGMDSELLVSMSNKNSFGEDSPFGWMHKNNVIQIILGTDYTSSFTFCHYCECKAEVPYRFIKEFTGEYIDTNGKSAIRKYEYPCRIYEYGDTEQMNRIGSILEQKGIADKMVIYDIPIRKVKLGDAYKIVYDDAKNNMCRNLYDFKVNREKIWGIR